VLDHVQANGGSGTKHIVATGTMEALKEGDLDVGIKWRWSARSC